MRQLLIFLLLILIVSSIPIYKINLDEMKSECITVIVEGNVKHPGSYQLPAYSCIEDVLDKAELLEDSDLNAINEKSLLKDQDKLIIPKKSEETSRKISINFGSKEELETIPGIGESMAQRIIDYRDENGLFQNVEDLVQVKGIGVKKLEKIMEHICL